jgi:predicted RNase H-like HicB family nuclease
MPVIDIFNRNPRINYHADVWLTGILGVVMKEYEFTVVIEKDENGRYVAICPALQGCYTEGESEREARDLIEDAIRLHIQSRLSKNEPINQETFSERIRVAV